MTLHEWFFAAFGVVGLAAAVRLVTAKNVVHAALFLVVALAMVAAAYLLLSAEFVAWVQVLIYVGAIVVLLLFGLMLTRAPIGREALDNQQRGVSAIVAVGVLAGLSFLVWDTFRDAEIVLTPSRTAGVGDSLLRSFIMPFEVVSFLLLAALIGAIVLARKEEGVIRLAFPLIFSAALFAIGVYGVLARRNGVLVLMSIELMLNAVNINLVAFSQYLKDVAFSGQIFTLFVITVAAAEVGIGLAIVILIYRNRETINVDEVNLLKW